MSQPDMSQPETPQSPEQNPALTESDANLLGKNQFVWQPELAPAGPLSMDIDLGDQKAFVYRDNILIGMSTISSGKPGHETPTGSFTVLAKTRFHRSNKYDDAPMPFMQRLTWSGLALHAGNAKGYPTSHGCIRLPRSFAADLFGEPTVGMRVEITEQPPGQQPGGQPDQSSASS